MKQTTSLLALALFLALPLLAAEALSRNDPTRQNDFSAAVFSCGVRLPMDLKIEESGLASPVNPLAQLAHDAISPDSAIAQPAIAALRARGPAGLEAMLKAHGDLLNSHSSISLAIKNPNQNDAWLRFKTALDAISRQRDSYVSKLYWFTDFEQAKAAARSSGKPILSLRLLGNLDEDLSCANSRFFRTTLYANNEVSAYLRDHFILHWKSVRPVPKVTIDFGDGRKLERTITGNSIHYVLNSDGCIIDALPGLYGAQAFLGALQRAEEIADQSLPLSINSQNRLLLDYHCARLAALESDLSRDLFVVPASPSASEAPIDDSTWAKIATLHSEEARLDQTSRTLLISKAPPALTAGRLTVSKIAIENPVLRQLRNLERTISEDTVRNEYLFHTKIHEWLATDSPAQNLDAFNEKVYAELFLTPDSDPWLGLAQPDVCTALENNGVVSNAQ